MTLVSILTPVRNGIEYLEECIHSVLQQTYTNWEMIVAINGHGLDGGAAYRQALEMTKDSRVKILVQDTTVEGKVASLRDALAKARGEWICLLDCDDVWEPTKLEEQIRASKEEARGAAVVGTWCRYIGDMSGCPALKGGWLTFEDLISCNQLINSGVLIHRSWCHWRDTFLEDYELWLRIALFGGTLYNVPLPLVRHRIHSTSAFNSKHVSPNSLRESYSAVKLLLDLRV